jgi:dTDP-4-amino-4,6-dideoxygalactose transaminase
MSISRKTAKPATPILVTRPLLPPLHELLPHLERIWESRFLTNGGQYHASLEAALCRFLGVEHVSLIANGTLALITALQVMDLSGEVITTPYSFVATAHAALWNRLDPVFVDIDAKTMNMDPARIEAAITPRTRAILPVHCYGHACDVEAIQAVADAHGLKVVYDAAHAFGVRWRERSILCHGDLSVLSFHATKVFNTFEGGAIVSRDAQTKARIDRLRNFGMADESTVLEVGQNGKMSEFNAALGLVQLDHVEEAMARRRRIDATYRTALADVPGIRCVEGCDAEVKNCAYFPILVEPGYPLQRDELYERLREHGIWARRYFHPLISSFPMYAGLPSASPSNLPVAVQAASRVLCLPIYPDLAEDEQAHVIQVIRSA